MKKCTTCKKQKDFSCFNKNKCKRDGYQTICKDCSSERSKKYYKSHTEEHKANTNKRRFFKRKELKSKIDEIKQICGCANCDEKDIICLEFHHVDPSTKEFDVSFSTRDQMQWNRIIEEINKCVCLCANCHRKVHVNRFEITSEMMCVNKISPLSSVG